MTPAKYSPVTERTVLDLAALVGKSNVAVDMEKRIAYSYDEVPRFSWDREYIAEAVVFPETTEHVSAVLEYANRNRIPVTPRGRARGFPAGPCPSPGGSSFPSRRCGGSSSWTRRTSPSPWNRGL